MDEDLELLWHDDMEDAQWLDLLQSFNTAKALYLSWDVAPRIAPALRELVGERATEVLPSLQDLFLEELCQSGPVPEAFEKFVAARELCGHRVSVSQWDKEQEEL